MRELNKIIVHCSDTKDSDASVNAKKIDDWHRRRGFNGIGYHFVILRDGTVEQGRPIAKMGAHVKGQNKGSIGICLVGRSEFSASQYSSLQGLIIQIWQNHGKLDVFGHRDFTKSKTCPNFDVKAWLETWQKQPKESVWQKILKVLKKLVRK